MNTQIANLSNELLISQLNNKFSINLNNNEIVFIKSLTTKHPEVFKDIQNNIEEILKDGKFDLHDIPNVIAIISNVFNNNNNKINILLDELEINKINYSNVIKCILFNILESGLLPILTTEINILEKIINNSFKLLEIVIENENKIENICFCENIKSFLEKYIFGK